MNPNFCFILLLSLGLSMCTKEHVDSGRTPILELNGHVLNKEDLPQPVAGNYTVEDSIALVDGYIKRWVTDAMMYDYAKKNVQNPQEIDRMVEEYRKTLTVQHYQQMLVNQRLTPPSLEQKRAYYEQNSSHFLLEEDIVKGVLVKVPKTTQKLRDLRTWLRDVNDENLEKMENFCVRNYGTLDYFHDRWLTISEVQKNMPGLGSQLWDSDATGSIIEREDSVYVYMLKSIECSKRGSVAPYDFAERKIESILLNQHRIDFIRNFEEDLYKHAQMSIHYFEQEEL